MPALFEKNAAPLNQYSRESNSPPQNTFQKQLPISNENAEASGSINTIPSYGFNPSSEPMYTQSSNKEDSPPKIDLITKMDPNTRLEAKNTSIQLKFQDNPIEAVNIPPQTIESTNQPCHEEIIESRRQKRAQELLFEQQERERVRLERIELEKSDELLKIMKIQEVEKLETEKIHSEQVALQEQKKKEESDIIAAETSAREERMNKIDELSNDPMLQKYMSLVKDRRAGQAVTNVPKEGEAVNAC